MRLFLWVLVLAGLLAGAAWLTRPGIAAFDAHLRARIEQAVAQKDIGADDDPLATIALVGCKLRPSDCFDVIRGGFDVRLEDRAFYSRFQIEGFGNEASCSGAFTKIWCDERLFGG
ncbi:MAG: hypothetical protein WBB85_20840 [Albidovulum sp.]|uniref:hypothetical protein n=1 Tax=Albidovulum sp. TaxID=1872424 RepID=UPI003CA41A70